MTIQTYTRRLPDKVLVIGGSRGIGRSTVVELTAAGSRCAIGYVENDDRRQGNAGNCRRHRRTRARAGAR